MLSARALVSGYGEAQALFGVDLDVGEGEVVALLGRNGMGKTTTISTIMGLVKPWSGQVRLDGVDLAGSPPFRVARAGVGLVPEGRRVFATLTVDEHLRAVAAARRGPPKWTPARVYDILPRLAERRRHRGEELSGGEQQMLAIARALVTNPRLLILDEATEGLAPLLREEVWTLLAVLKAQGEAILVVDKNVEALARLADRFVVLEKGHVVWTGERAAFAAAQDMRARYLHL